MVIGLLEKQNISVDAFAERCVQDCKSGDPLYPTEDNFKRLVDPLRDYSGQGTTLVMLVDTLFKLGYKVRLQITPLEGIKCGSS